MRVRDITHWTMRDFERMSRFRDRLRHKMRYLLMLDDGYLFPVNDEDRRKHRRYHRHRHIPQVKRGHRRIK